MRSWVGLWFLGHSMLGERVNEVRAACLPAALQPIRRDGRGQERARRRSPAHLPSAPTASTRGKRSRADSDARPAKRNGSRLAPATGCRDRLTPSTSSVSSSGWLTRPPLSGTLYFADAVVATCGAPGLDADYQWPSVEQPRPAGEMFAFGWPIEDQVPSAPALCRTVRLRAPRFSRWPRPRRSR
jgi:hypothetical protein